VAKMKLEGNYYSFTLYLPGNFFQTIDDPTVAKMNSIKSTHSNYRFIESG